MDSVLKRKTNRLVRHSNSHGAAVSGGPRPRLPASVAEPHMLGACALQMNAPSVCNAADFLRANSCSMSAGEDDDD